MALENEIISSVYSEEMFEEVKFLEVKDFQNKTNQMLWGLITDCKGDTIELINRMSHLERHSYTIAIQKACLGVACYKVAQMGLKLVELRFQQLFMILVDDLLKNSQNKVEKECLIDIRGKVIDSDIFVLSDHAKEYVGKHASTYTQMRFDDFLKYRQKRIEKIKLVTNGNR